LQRFVASSTVGPYPRPDFRPGLGFGLSEGVVIAKLLLTT